MRWWTNGIEAKRLPPWEVPPKGFWLGRSNKYKESISAIAKKRRDEHPETRLFVRDNNAKTIDE